ncbi:Rne/Rng family ribonuclease [Arthrobacter sp. zg-Y820]|uniref:Rne/Rng family ribonuclease n=1 Tax=unclassified Arthrobacter TaxID=235627 RepID=UPI001E44914F|nr:MULTISPECIES: Rne/Rng family ribonuclease [unclassified Arthrobacter]MCC9196328.1 Rne/Rng family ribonuclease [Arthrobacter sp. zg-Y820]MDK1279189.1 Rne/Rng family ribonuclease [Arthrobacter sp. zg.Y820]WIB08410.1 Rne/Rng family ribonuclease [Arthrobacter sp. zg-Y820]
MSDALNNDLAASKEPAESAPEANSAQVGDSSETKAPAKRATRSRRKSVAASAPAESSAGTAGTTTAANTADTTAAAEAPAAEAPAADAAEKPKRVRASRRKTVPAGAAASAAAGTAAGETAADVLSPAAEEAPAEAPASENETPAEAAPVKAVRRRRAPAKKAAEAPEAETPEAASAETAAVPAEAAVADAPEEVAAPEAAETKTVPKTRTRRRPAKAAAEKAPEASAPAENAAAEAPAREDTLAAPAPVAEEAEEAEELSSLNPFAIPALPLFHAPDLTSVRAVPVPEAGEDAEEDEDSTEDANRSRRRSRRGRNRTRSESPNAAGADSEQEAAPEEAAAGPDTAEGVTSRRRRRRRRGDADLELTGGADDDPPNTVTRVRAPRAHAEAPVSDRVTSVKGSTRLEAKKQRRRESRESGRRRHVITEAEFLARRESVDRQMIVRQRDDRIQIGVLEDGVLAEHFVSNTQQDSLIGNVYVGKVQNVLPSMEAAFVDIGRGRNAVLYAGEVNWDAAGLDGQPRRIELALKSGDSVLVQVTKDPVGHKGARLTSQISLPGRYLVYVPGGSMTGISRKLPDVERNRLKKILKDHLPQDAGVIVRTAAEGASEEELMNDINRLRAQWETIDAKAKSTKTLAPELLYGEPDLTIKVVRDVFNEDFSKLIVSGEEAWDTIEAYVTYVAPDLVGRLEKWTKDEDIFAESRIDEQIAKALDRKVFLPSGGSLVIDRTEAMTVVDVNTGKFTGSGGNLEETVTKNNLEAAEEVVRQLRLRDIGGIIVIDFIDMVLEANRDLVLRRLVECLGRDRTKHQVAEVTSLGLVQMTRKRMGTGLLEVFGEECEACAGRGVITHEVPVEHRRSTSHNGSTGNGVVAHAVSEENHQQHLRQEKQSRGDRKRNRSRGQGAPQQAVAAAAEEPAKTEEAGNTDAERQAKAKAEAARAALATIAAATAAAHDAVEAGERAPGGSKPASEVSAAEAPSAAPAPEDGATDAGTVLQIQGETVVVPRRDRRAPAQEESRFTLESLTEAFNEVAAAAAPEGRNAPEARQEPVRSADARNEPQAARTAPRRSRRSSAAARNVQAAPLQAAPAHSSPEPAAEAPEAPAAVQPPAAAPVGSAAPVADRQAAAAPVRTPRRRRAAGSPQGAAGADAIQTGGTEPAAAPVAVRHAAAPAAAQKQEKRRESAGSAPVILGVGVPASEL